MNSKAGVSPPMSSTTMRISGLTMTEFGSVDILEESTGTSRFTEASRTTDATTSSETRESPNFSRVSIAFTTAEPTTPSPNKPIGVT